MRRSWWSVVESGESWVSRVLHVANVNVGRSNRLTRLNISQIIACFNRDVAQLGSASALGAGCRRFKSCHPDFKSILNQLYNISQI